MPKVASTAESMRVHSPNLGKENVILHAFVEWKK
jgi:hypothetical protein